MTMASKILAKLAVQRLPRAESVDWLQLAELSTERGELISHLRAEAGEERWARYQAAMRPGLVAYEQGRRDRLEIMRTAYVRALEEIFAGVDDATAARWAEMWTRIRELHRKTARLNGTPT